MMMAEKFQDLYTKVFASRYLERFGAEFDSNDPYNKVFYEQKNGEQFKKFANLWNLDSYVDIFREKFQEIVPFLSQGRVLIMSNHSSWVNLSNSTYILKKSLESENLKSSDFYTFVGSAITYHKTFSKIACENSNLLKTIPDKVFEEYLKKVDISSQAQVRQLLRSIKMELYRKLLEIMNEEISRENTFFMMAPSGTTDVYENNQIKMRKPTKGVITLVNKINPVCIVYVGTNDLDIFKNNQTPYPGKTYIKISSPIEPKDFPKTPDDIMEGLLPLIVDKNGNQIGGVRES